MFHELNMKKKKLCFISVYVINHDENDWCILIKNKNRITLYFNYVYFIFLEINLINNNFIFIGERHSLRSVSQMFRSAAVRESKLDSKYLELETCLSFVFFLSVPAVNSL